MRNSRNDNFYILPIKKHMTMIIPKTIKHWDLSYTRDDPIKKVIHNDPATIVYWLDGSKTVVKCGENDIYDPEKGLAMAIAKKFLGNKGSYYDTFKKWLPEEEDFDPGEYSSASESLADDVRIAIMTFLRNGLCD